MDPFEFNKLDKVGSGQPSSAAALPAKPGGVGEQVSNPVTGGATGGAVSQHDDVQLSEEAEGSESAGCGAAINFGAWTPQAPASGSKAAGQAGMQAGAVIGPEGVSGLEPGMHSGGVHNASELPKPA